MMKQHVILLIVTLVAALIGGLVATKLSRQGEEAVFSGTLTSQGIRIVDQGGIPRILLGLDGLQTSLKLYGPDSKSCITMSLGAIHSALGLYGDDWSTVRIYSADGDPLWQAR